MSKPAEKLKQWKKKIHLRYVANSSRPVWLCFSCKESSINNAEIGQASIDFNAFSSLFRQLTVNPAWITLMMEYHKICAVIFLLGQRIALPLSWPRWRTLKSWAAFWNHYLQSPKQALLSTDSYTGDNLYPLLHPTQKSWAIRPTLSGDDPWGLQNILKHI